MHFTYNPKSTGVWSNVTPPGSTKFWPRFLTKLEGIPQKRKPRPKYVFTGCWFWFRPRMACFLLLYLERVRDLIQLRICHTSAWHRILFDTELGGGGASKFGLAFHWLPDLITWNCFHSFRWSESTAKSEWC
jgi:hypothetical protein